MGWRTTGDVAEFLATAGAFLRGERARNTVLLTVTETIRKDPARYRARGDADQAGQPGQPGQPGPAGLPLFGWWTPDAPDADAPDADAPDADAPDNAGAPDNAADAPGTDAVRGAFLHTPPLPVLLSAVPAEAAAGLAGTTLAGRPLGGVNAYPEAAAAFADAWRDVTGGRVEVHRRDRLYRLAGLAWPALLPDGAPRLADESDAALVTAWFGAFAREVGDLARDADHAAAVRERLSYQGITLWETRNAPVALAGVTRQVAGMVRIGPVYTPPEHRGHGYGTAVTAAVSQRVQAVGAEEVLLYTDLANPVSNSIYQRIGYRPVEDRVLLSFSPESPGPPAAAR